MHNPLWVHGSTAFGEEGRTLRDVKVGERREGGARGPVAAASVPRVCKYAPYLCPWNTARRIAGGGGIRRKDKLKKMVVGCETENAFKMTSESATW